YWSDGIVYGPRFAFEAVAALALLTARGAALLATPPCCVPDAKLALPPPPSAGGDSSDAVAGLMPRRLTATPPVALLMVWLISTNLVGYLPDVVLAYTGYNGVSRAGLRTAEDAGLHQALVFVTSSDADWQSYAQVFLANGPLLD